jgi:hypothetical protein
MPSPVALQLPQPHNKRRVPRWDLTEQQRKHSAPVRVVQTAMWRQGLAGGAGGGCRAAARRAFALTALYTVLSSGSSGSSGRNVGRLGPGSHQELDGDDVLWSPPRQAPTECVVSE